ncbi:MAG: alkylphosphonate utilization protein, partial [Saprospiraceae bacterium]|nr:alkylphosphonate utilization protein [Saprospiraceae bacterium]
VVSYRMLQVLSDQEWALDLLGMIYMDDETLEWAEGSAGDDAVHKDSNGHILKTGDSVVLIKDLDVKGANFIAKRGTPVRRITLVHDNPEQIEGRVNDQHIVILTKYVKKSV